MTKETPSDGQTESYEASWVVGCDGARSDVRRHLGIDFQGTADDEVFIWADVLLETALADAEGHNFKSSAGLAIGRLGHRRSDVQSGPTSPHFPHARVTRE